MKRHTQRGVISTLLRFRMEDGKIYSHEKVKNGRKVFGVCPLCRKRKKIIRSHINPDWAWIKAKISASTGSKINTGEWFYLLCGECDRFLGRYEALLADASRLQPNQFQSLALAREINIALLGIMWKASIANKKWKGTSGWNREVDAWARSILWNVKTNKKDALRTSSYEMHWDGTKFFCAENNPFAMQAQPHLSDGCSSVVLGTTFLAGIKWTLVKGQGSFTKRIFLWDGVTPVANIDLKLNQVKDFEKLAINTLDSEACPCGKHERTGFGEETAQDPYNVCCKNGWLTLPITIGYYISWKK